MGWRGQGSGAGACRSCIKNRTVQAMLDSMKNKIHDANMQIEILHRHSISGLAVSAGQTVIIMRSQILPVERLGV